MANEKRLIDANALLEQLFDKRERYADSHSVYEDAVYIGIGKAIISIDEAPTVDAVEVVHAYWTGSRINPLFDEYEEHCSHCGAWSVEYGKPYCPNCGAKMNGGVKKHERFGNIQKNDFP